MPVSPETAQSFVSFCQQHLKGDEKSEAQTFLTRFFQMFGHAGIQEVGAEFEQRLKKGSAKGKMGFADLVWHSGLGVPGVVIEMKSRREDLAKHYSQLERYWMRIAPNRPRYAMLCNFDEFWIFDFENQVDEPVDRILLTDLPQRLSTFRFMEVGGQDPIFRNNQVEVTDRTARRMGDFFRAVYERGKKGGFQAFGEENLQRFTLQCVMAMFAEDRGLLPDALFLGLIDDCRAGKGTTYDLLGGLFTEMNRKGITPAGRYKGVDYFNGGLFADIQPIELTSSELDILDVCARDNWQNVRPSIFGNIFEGAIDSEQRHAHGIHFTSELDIRQIVRPTISDYWEERVEAATTIGDLQSLQLELQSYRVLDPACGSGNFLYVAYQELKRIEQLLLEKLMARRKKDKEQAAISFVSPTQFYGMDTNPFAVELARVTLMIGRKIAIDKYDLTESALPLDALDQNIVCQDALFHQWPVADAVIGNPPFLGGKHMRIALGDGYIERVFERFPQVKDSVDFCAYWFRLAHDHIGKSGRAGLVGTNSIAQGKSRAAALDYITQNGGHIHEAISTQAWSGEANVHVSLVNWSRQVPIHIHLDQREVQHINSSLSSALDVTGAKRLKANLNYSFQGVIPVGKGFIITPEQAQDWIKKDKRNQEVLKPFSMGSNLAKNPLGQPERWIIDFNNMDVEDATGYVFPFRHIQETVKPERQKNRRDVTKENWWKFGEKRPAMRSALAPLSQYFAVPRVSKWAIFIQVPTSWLPGDLNIVVASSDPYVLGVLTSDAHRGWAKVQCSTLKGDIRYTHTSGFETFPFPQAPSADLVEQIRAVMVELNQYRSDEMTKKQWGITKLYNAYFQEPASKLYKFHAKLDALVLKAYGFSANDDILEKLLTLNLKLAAQEQAGDAVVGPWDPIGKAGVRH